MPKNHVLEHISVDELREDWESAMEEHEFPWISLAEIKESDAMIGKIAEGYGARFIPKGYLIASQGCIVRKDITPEKLRDVLVARYAETSDFDQ